MSCFLHWHLKVWMIPVSIGGKWLVQFGGKYITLIFLCFLPLFGNPIEQETPQKWLKSSMNWNLLYIWWQAFLQFCSSRVCCTRHSPVEVMSLCHQHCNLAEPRPSALILFHHGENHHCMSVCYWVEIIEESSYINIKYILRLVSVDYFGQFFTFLVH